LLFAACVVVAALGIGLELAHVISPTVAFQTLVVAVVAAALTWWIWRRARFCRQCGASTKAALGEQELAWCPACYNLTDPAQVGVFDLRAAGYWDRGETVPQFLAVVTLLAIHENACQVRFEPTRSSYEPSLSIGDETYQITPAPVFLQFPVAQTVKAMAGLDVKTCDRPQEGNIRVVAPDRTITMRVMVEPSEFGQRVVFRFLPADSCPEIS